MYCDGIILSAIESRQYDILVEYKTARFVDGARSLSPVLTIALGADDEKTDA